MARYVKLNEFGQNFTTLENCWISEAVHGLASCCNIKLWIIKEQEVRSVNARIYIAAFSTYFRDLNYFSFIYSPDAFTSAIHPQNLISYFNTDRLAPIKKLYSLHQSALDGDQNGIQFLGLCRFVLEELNYNVPTYISS